MSVNLSGEITAIATAVLAVGAIVTAIFAVRAFRKQSQEVGAIERQVADQQELTRQQAELLKVQSGQLEVQRRQLDDQHAAIEDQIRANARQAEVLELQATELRESLDSVSARLRSDETLKHPKCSSGKREQPTALPTSRPCQRQSPTSSTPATSPPTMQNSTGGAALRVTASRIPSRWARSCPEPIPAAAAISRATPTWRSAAPSSDSETLRASYGCAGRTAVSRSSCSPTAPLRLSVPSTPLAVLPGLPAQRHV